MEGRGKEGRTTFWESFVFTLGSAERKEEMRGTVAVMTSSSSSSSQQEQSTATNSSKTEYEQGRGNEISSYSSCDGVLRDFCFVKGRMRRIKRNKERVYERIVRACEKKK